MSDASFRDDRNAGPPDAARAILGWIVVAAAVLAVVLLWPAGSGAQELDDEEVRRGGELYAMYCAACHGAAGQGGHLGEPGDDIHGPPVDDVDVAYVDLSIRTGRMPIISREAGIVHDPDLDDEDREQIVAWMTEAFELEGEVPEVPDGNAARGRILFNEHCAACHSTTGEGGVAGGGMFILPARDVDRVAIHSASRVGPFGMPRFGETVLSDEDLADIGTAIEAMDLERPSPLAITDVTHVSEGVYGTIAMILLLGLVVFIAKMPRITTAVEEHFDIDDHDEGEEEGA
jgi:ubiquinol-cytochrome c reductase cytochrome c subunit